MYGKRTGIGKTARRRSDGSGKTNVSQTLFEGNHATQTGGSLITVDPKFEFRYVHGQSKNFKTDNGEIGSIDSTSSLVSRFNLQTSYLPEERTSNRKLFLELRLYNEWISRTKVKFADTHLTTSDLNGLGFDASLRFNAAVAEDAYCCGAVTLEAGEPIPHTS